MHVSHSIKLSCEGFTVILRQVLPEFNQDDGCHMSQLVFWDFFPRAPHSQEHFAQISAATLSHSLSHSFFILYINLFYLCWSISHEREHPDSLVWPSLVSYCTWFLLDPNHGVCFLFFRFARQLFHLLKGLKHKKSRAVSQFKMKLIRLYDMHDVINIFN